MEYQAVFRDFIYRTSENLRVIEDLAQRPDPQVGQVYEVTQLINSLPGLIVFPHQAFPDSIPEALKESRRLATCLSLAFLRLLLPSLTLLGQCSAT